MILRKEIIDELSKELSLPFKGLEQDWDIEMADSSRINDFLKFYQQNHLSADKKMGVMSFVLASYEDFLHRNSFKVEDRWNDIKFILESEKVIFIDLINYWSLNNEVEGEDLFLVTPLMRNIDRN